MVAAAMVLMAAASLSAKASFSSLDLEKASLKDIQKAYEDDRNDYQASLASLRKKLDKAYAQNNARRYYDTMDQINDLTEPGITQEQDETLVSRMMNADGEEKDAWGQWLFENDPYYRPTLTLEMENSGKHSRYTFRQTVSVAPGSDVDLPKLQADTDKGVFVGWGITPDAVTYKAGDKVVMPYADQTLYAIFQNGVKFTDSITGIDTFTSDADAAVPEVQAPDASYIFDGWYDQDGKKLEGTTVSAGDGSSSYTAYWKSIAFDDIKTRYYKDLTVPAGEQVSLSFTIKNQGNEALSDVKVSMEDNDALTNLTGELSARYMREGASLKGTFVVVASGKSGDRIDTHLVVTDEDGDSWTIPVALQVK